MTSAAPRGSGRATSRRPRRRTRPARTVQTLRRIHFPESGPPLATGGFSFGAADRWKKIPPSCTAKVLPRRFPKSPGKNSRAFFFAPEKFAQVNACNLLMLIAYFVSSFWDVRGSEFLFGNYFGCPRRKVPIKWIEPQKVLQLSTADLRNNSSKWLTLHFGCTVSGATFSRKSGHRAHGSTFSVTWNLSLQSCFPAVRRISCGWPDPNAETPLGFTRVLKSPRECDEQC